MKSLIGRDKAQIGRKNSRRRSHMIFYACIVALPLLQFCICYIYVNLNSFILAFQKYSVKSGELGFLIEFAGFDNFKEAWSLINQRWFMFGNSLHLFFWVTIVGFTLALLFSFYIYKKYPLGEFFRVVLFMPKIISGVVFALLFKYIADDVFVKIMNDYLNVKVDLGLLANSDTQLSAVLFYNVWIGFGVNVLMFSGSMSGIDESIVESAQLDGTTLLQEFIYITIPMIWPTFVSFLVINITAIFTDQMHLHQLYGNNIRDYHLVEENAKSEYWFNGEIVSKQATGGILGVLWNTIVYTVIGAFLHSIVPALVAYAVSKFDFKFNGIITGLALFAMIMPIVGTQSSMLAMLRQIGLYDTIWGYLLQKFSFTGMYFFVFCAFYKSLSNSFAEAAEIDGASQLHILLSIIIPLSSKMLASVFLVQFVGFWNDYQTAFLYMPSHPTLAYTIWFLTNNNQVGGGEMVVRVAGAMTLAVPILIAFTFLKNKLMGNITMGGLKQ